MAWNRSPFAIGRMLSHASAGHVDTFASVGPSPPEIVDVVLYLLACGGVPPVRTTKLNRVKKRLTSGDIQKGSRRTTDPN